MSFNEALPSSLVPDPDTKPRSWRRVQVVASTVAVDSLVVHESYDHVLMHAEYPLRVGASGFMSAAPTPTLMLPSDASYLPTAGGR